MKASVRSCAVWALALLLSCSAAPPRTPPGAGSEAAPRLKAGNESQRRWLDIYSTVQGRPYRAGGTDKKGFDCSGLVQYAYRHFDGRTLPRTTRDLYRAGSPVKRMQSGDLVFYGTRKRPTHVGIYLWNDWFLHAGSEGVTLSSTREHYYAARFLGARRLP